MCASVVMTDIGLLEGLALEHWMSVVRQFLAHVLNVLCFHSSMIVSAFHDRQHDANVDYQFRGINVYEILFEQYLRYLQRQQNTIVMIREKDCK